MSSEQLENQAGEDPWSREEVVRKVKELARRKNISLYEEPEVIDQLLDLDLEADLPPALIEVISELASFISTDEV